MYEELSEDEQIDLRNEYTEELASDARYENRSQEDILEDTADWFSQKYATKFEEAYNDLLDDLKGYGLENSTDNIFQNCLEESTCFTTTDAYIIKNLHKIIKYLKIRMKESITNKPGAANE